MHALQPIGTRRCVLLRAAIDRPDSSPPRGDDSAAAGRLRRTPGRRSRQRGEEQRPVALRSVGGVVRAGVADARKLLPEEIDLDVGGDEEDLCQLAVRPGAARQPVRQDAVAHAVRQQVHLAPGAAGERLEEAAEGVRREQRALLVGAVAEQRAARWPAEEHHAAAKVEIESQLRGPPRGFLEAHVVAVREHRHVHAVPVADQCVAQRQLLEVVSHFSFPSVERAVRRGSSRRVDLFRQRSVAAAKRRPAARLRRPVEQLLPPGPATRAPAPQAATAAAAASSILCPPRQTATRHGRFSRRA
nr:hypothetical protein [Accumulibacter sp.]